MEAPDDKDQPDAPADGTSPVKPQSLIESDEGRRRSLDFYGLIGDYAAELLYFYGAASAHSHDLGKLEARRKWDAVMNERFQETARIGRRIVEDEAREVAASALERLASSLFQLAAAMNTSSEVSLSLDERPRALEDSAASTHDIAEATELVREQYRLSRRQLRRAYPGSEHKLAPLELLLELPSGFWRLGRGVEIAAARPPDVGATAPPHAVITPEVPSSLDDAAIRGTPPSAPMGQGYGRATADGPRPIATSVSFRVQPARDCPDFSAVGGMDDLKRQLRSTIGLVLAEPAKAAALGIRFNGVLLHGPPGTGKTFVAKACAGEFNLNLISIGSADIISAYTGDSGRLVAAAFELAERSAPVMLLFDEFDAIAAKRGNGGPGGGGADRQVVEQLLRNLEGVRDRPDVIVMATTNRLDDLDPAVVRPGRFDLKVRVDMPDLDARNAIFEAALRGRRAAAIDTQGLAAHTEGLSAASIVATVNAAALATLQRSGTADPVIMMSDLAAALANRGGKDRPQTRVASWHDVVLPDATRQELQQLQLLIQDPARARAFGITPPRGVLLHGPPGTGKTMIARVLASETKASFYPVSGADILSKWWGESEDNLAQLFARARENRPSIVFFDEIDALARERGGASGDAGIADRLVNQLLQEIDGLAGAEGIFILAATNRREIVDEALLRGGRLGRQIYIGLPDDRGRDALLRLYAEDMPLDADVDLATITAATDGWSGAALRQLCEQAALEAMMATPSNGTPRITARDFRAALETAREQRP